LLIAAEVIASIAVGIPTHTGPTVLIVAAGVAKLPFAGERMLTVMATTRRGPEKSHPCSGEVEE
jgi:hypothetical protein